MLWTRRACHVHHSAAMGYHRVRQRRLQGRRDCQRHHERRQGERRVGRPHDNRLGPAAVVAGDEAEQHAHGDAEAEDDAHEHERQPVAEEDAREHVAADVVGPQRVVEARRLERVREVGELPGVFGVRRDDGREDGEQDDGDDDSETDDAHRPAIVKRFHDRCQSSRRSAETNRSRTPADSALMSPPPSPV